MDSWPDVRRAAVEVVEQPGGGAEVTVTLPSGSMYRTQILGGALSTMTVLHLLEAAESEASAQRTLAGLRES